MGIREGHNDAQNFTGRAGRVHARSRGRDHSSYVEACQIVAGRGVKDEVRFALAERMMFLARSGETDEHRLCRLSVAAVLGREPMPDHAIRVIHDA